VTQVGSAQAEGQARIERQRQADALTYHQARPALHAEDYYYREKRPEPPADRL
jgi:hypothetical protein